jgi:hypothetical protein
MEFLANDARQIQQHLSMQKVLKKQHHLMQRNKNHNPVSAAANILANSLAAIHQPETVIAEDKEEEDVVDNRPELIPSEIRFISNDMTSNQMMMMMSDTGRRPPIGFILFTYETILLIEQEINPLTNRKKYYNKREMMMEVASRWSRIEPEKLTDLITREQLLNEQGAIVLAKEAEERKQQQAAAAAATEERRRNHPNNVGAASFSGFGFGTGFVPFGGGGGFGSRGPSVGFGFSSPPPPQPPSESQSAVSVVSAVEATTSHNTNDDKEVDESTD